MEMAHQTGHDLEEAGVSIGTSRIDVARLMAGIGNVRRGEEGSILPVKGAKNGRGSGGAFGEKVGSGLVDERLEVRDAADLPCGG